MTNLNSGGTIGRGASLAITFSLLAGCGATAARAQDFAWSGSVARGEAVTVRGVNGTITARGVAGGEVRVEAVKEGRNDEPEEVRIEVVEDAEGVLVCAIYPSRPGDEPNRCARGEEYENRSRNHDVQVHFTIDVPAGVDFEGHAVNGSVEARGIAAGVEARTVNGDVTMAISGAASANTVNGSIEATVEGGPSEGLSFRTVNGGIRVALPEGSDADLSVRTVNGSIDTDFPLTIRRRWGPKSASGEIGAGGPEISLRTVNGSIELVRSG